MADFRDREQARTNKLDTLKAAAADLHRWTIRFCLGEPFYNTLHSGKPASRELIELSQNLQKADSTLDEFRRDGAYPHDQKAVRSSSYLTGLFLDSPEAVGAALDTTLAYMREKETWGKQTLDGFDAALASARENGLFSAPMVKQAQAESAKGGRV